MTPARFFRDDTLTWWPNQPYQNQLGTATYFSGSIADVAFYNSQLSAQQMTQEYTATKYSAGLTPVRTVNVTDPGGKTLTYVMDPLNANRILALTDGLGNTTRYGYDTGGFLHTVTDPNGNVVTTGHDLRGNLVSETSCQNQAANSCTTAYYSYYPDDTTAQPAPDPRNDMLVTERGPGSASAADSTYLTTYAYDTSGDLTGVTTPEVAGFPQGRTTTGTYTTATTPAVGGGTTPPGLVATVTTPAGAVTPTLYYSSGDIAQVTNPDGLVTKYAYDGTGRMVTKTVVSSTYPAGLTTSYAYDQMDQVVTETDPAVTDRVTSAAHTAQVTTTYDSDGNVTARTAADTTGGDAFRTITRLFNTRDQLISSTDPAGAVTQFSYDAYGNLASRTDAANNVTTYAYDTNGHPLTATLQSYTGSPAGSQAAGPLVELSRAYDPKGRLASVTDSMGWVTSYTYTDNGLTATVVRTDPHTGASFTSETDSYDNAGRLIHKVTNNGATTTSYVLDAAGRTTSQTLDPAGLDRATTYTYSPDDHVTSQVLTGPGSTTPVRSTSYTYDPMGNLTSRTRYLRGGGNPAGWWRLDQTTGTAVPDSSGTGNNATASNVTWSGGAGTFNGTSSQVVAQAPALDTAGSFTVSAWASLASTAATGGIVSQPASVMDGFRLQFSVTNGSWTFNRTGANVANNARIVANAAAAPQLNTWTHLVGTYDASTGQMILYVNGAQAGTATDTTPFAANGPLTIGHCEWNGAAGNYFSGAISDVQVYQRALAPADVSALYALGRDAAASPANKLTTTWTLDQRGLPVSMTDPNGNTTSYAYDEAGQLAVTTQPSVSTQVYGGAPVQASPVTVNGYDTFGEPAETSDPNGNVTTTAYDADGRAASVTRPPYTPPGSSTAISAVTATGYDSLGQVTSRTDPLGNKTTYAYDQLGNLTSVTAPNLGVTAGGYDTLGDLLSVTGPTGAQTQATWDYLGRQSSFTQSERSPAAAYTTQYNYGTGGWLSSRTTPAGVATSYGYDAAGEATSVTDGARYITKYGYDPAGQRTSVTNPDNTSITFTFDQAGRQIGQADLSATGTVLRSASAAYDGDGNLASVTDYRRYTTSFTYDPTGVVASQTQPVTGTTSITTSFGYDAAGNRTFYTDGNGHQWWTAYNHWNLPESQIEPATAAFPSAAQGTFTTAYNADGQPATLTQPGGVTVTSGYDNMGQLTSQSGSGAEAATATRSLAYDLAGHVTSAATTAAGTTAATSESFTYNDRGLVLTASGSGGTSSFSYNGDSQPTSVTDTAGTTSYAYDSAGRLAALADPLTGTTATYSYNQLSQPSQITYGTSGNTRAFGYTGLHQLNSDTLKTAAGQAIASIGYGYDANGNLTSKTTTGFAGASSNTYTYDQANRLTSWNNGTTTAGYTYDNAGNLTQAGNQTLTYDNRDQLATSTTGTATTSYAYTARGTMASAAGPSGTTSYTSDAYGHAITSGPQNYAYDALGRLVTAAGTSATFGFTYAGPASQIASDGTWNYTWDPAGTLAAAGPAGGGTAQATIAWTDAHTDVVATFTPAGTTLAGSTTYDPYGTITAASGTAGNLGYQSGFTDPATRQVHMGARWYSPGTGQFTSRDTATVNPVPNPAVANPFAYVGDNPLTGTDPTGHRACFNSCSDPSLYAPVQPLTAPPPPFNFWNPNYPGVSLVTRITARVPLIPADAATSGSHAGPKWPFKTGTGILVMHLGIPPGSPFYNDVTANYIGGWRSWLAGIGYAIISPLG